MKRKLLYFGLSLGALMLLAQSCFYSPRYIYRVIAWQDADYDDFKRFKSAPIEAAETPFVFSEANNAARQEFEDKFKAAAKTDDIDLFLEEQQTYSFIVIRNDSILYENYFHGNTRESIQTSFSVSKSVLSLLMGIAIDNGAIDSVDDPITKYLPELKERDERFSEITVGHLLRMRSGIEYSRKISFPFVTSDDPKAYYHPDLRRVALKHTIIEKEPNSGFLYNNYNALLIGLILERATGEPVSTYLQDHVWKKIGTEFDASWSLDENEFEKMESGLNARSIDFAKLGRLALSRGIWNEKEVIDPDWMHVSTQPREGVDYVYGDPTQWTYSYFWWGIPEQKTASDFMGIGNMGQYIYVSPRSNTIIVRNGNETDAYGDAEWIGIFHEIANRLHKKASPQAESK